MSYVQRVLQPDEQVRYTSNIHWVIYLPGLLLLALGLAASVRWLAWQTMRDLWMIIALFLLLIAALVLFSAWFRRWTTEIAITSRRIIYKRGFIRRHTIEMNLDKVESVDVVQSIAGRIFGYGDVIVKGVGVGIEPLTSIDSPLEFRNHVTAH